MQSPTLLQEAIEFCFIQPSRLLERRVGLVASAVLLGALLLLPAAGTAASTSATLRIRSDFRRVRVKPAGCSSAAAASLLAVFAAAVPVPSRSICCRPSNTPSAPDRLRPLWLSVRASLMRTCWLPLLLLLLGDVP